MPAPSYADILNSGFRAIAIRPTNFSVVMAREPETTVNILCHVNAAMAEETAVYTDQKLAEIQFVTAQKIGGPVLDRLIFDRYGDDFEPRRDTPLAVAVLSLRRSGTVGFAVPLQTQIGTKGGATSVIFRTTQTVVFQEGDKGPLTVFAYATLAGPDGNVQAGTITDIIDRPEGGDPTLVCTNFEPAAGGGPREEDGQLAARARGFWSAARKGTRQAVEYAARTVAGVVNAIADELIKPFDKLPKWRGSVTVSDINGNGNAALAARVLGVMDETRALGVPIAVFGGSAIFVPIVISGLVFKDANTTTEVREEIRAALVADVALLVNGEPLSIGYIFATLLRFKDKVFAPEECITTPADDQYPTSKAKAFRTRSDLVKINGL